MIEFGMRAEMNCSSHITFTIKSCLNIDIIGVAGGGKGCYLT